MLSQKQSFHNNKKQSPPNRIELRYNFHMTVKTNLSKGIITNIFSNYDLGDLLDFQPISKGTVQTNYLVNTTESKFILRYYENRSKGSVDFECHLLNYLKSHEYPCPRVLANKQSEYVGIYNEKPYALFEFMEGENLENPTEEQQNQLIEQIANLQNLTKDYIPISKEDRWNYSVELCAKLAQKEAFQLNTETSSHKLEWLKSELNKLQLPESLPKGICHCDFHFSNVLFKEGKFNALIDFDDANYTFLTFDLVSLINPFISNFSWDTWNNYAKEDNVFDFKETKKVVSEYTKYRKMNTEETKHLFDVFKLAILFDCIWYFKRGEYQDFYEKRKIDYLNTLGRDEFFKN